MPQQQDTRDIPNYGSVPEKILEVRNLSISFGAQQVLAGISFFLVKGENLVVMGQSGSGKSVLIKCISRLHEPDGGEVYVFGKDILNAGKKEVAQLRKKIGFMFQGGALYDSMTVWENLAFTLKRNRPELSRKECDEKIVESLFNVGLEDAIEKMPSDLSGGMRKRLALARTIISDPEIILYDEPTSGLDPLTSSEISELMNRVRRKYGASSITITHDLACAREVADRAIILREGEVLIEGSMDNLERSKNKWVKRFLGKSR